MKNNTFILLSPIILLSFILSMFLLTSCTDNDRARKFGGTEEVILKENEVLVTVTWKETNLWILTQDTLTGKHYFREKSKWGLLDGTVTFKTKDQ